MPGSLPITPAAAADIPLMLDLIRALAVDEKMPGQALATAQDLFVTPQRRGRAIGKALLAHLAALAVARGCGRLDAQVLDGNPAVARLLRVARRRAAGRVGAVAPVG